MMREPETVSTKTYDLSLLNKSHAKWGSSPGLRLVYGDAMRAMRLAAASGAALEIGSGIGVLREFVPGVVTSDIEKTPYVDRAASAYEMDGEGEKWTTVYAFDVLHHLREPFRFFASAANALQPGGRIVLMEPAATLVGRWCYRICHQEPTRPAELRAPYVFPADDEEGSFANMGMGWVLFHRDRQEVKSLLAALGLRVVEVSYRDALAYLLTGGFSRPQLVPTGIIRGLLRLEKCLPQAWWRFAGLRMLVVLEKTA